MLTPREGLPSFWCTGLAKVLVGDQPCLRSAWLQGRYKFERSQQDSAALTLWKANHTELLSKTVDAVKADGWKCSVEKFWRVTGQTAVISGKADLIAQKTDERPAIIDVKSGTPRESDVCQVAIQMVTIPMAWNSPTMIFDGAVYYGSHAVEVKPAQAEALKPKLFAMLKFLGVNGKPDAAPSESACRFCDAPAELCAERYDEETAPSATTELF